MLPFMVKISWFLLNGINHSLESLGVVHGHIGQNLTVEGNAFGIDFSHELGVRHAVNSGGSIDSLNPKRPKFGFFLLTVAVCVLQPFFQRILGNRVNITTRQEISLCLLEDFFSSGPRGNCIN